MIGSPLYKLVILRLANGKTLRVKAENDSPSNVYIQSATINGKPLDIPVITWEQIQSGANIHFAMGPKPSQWASQWRPTLITAK
jgi:putative alpha-1,2-mannosidase